MNKKLLILCLMLFLTACASTPATHFYVLEAVGQPPQQATKALKKRLIGVGPLTMPALLDRK